MCSRYFSRAFTIWSKQNKFTPTFIRNLISHTEAEHAAGAWLLLSKVVASSPKLPYGNILDAWDKMIRWEQHPLFKIYNMNIKVGDFCKTCFCAQLKGRSRDDLLSHPECDGRHCCTSE